MKLPRKSMKKMGEKWERSQTREKQGGDGKMSKGKKKYTWKAFGKKTEKEGGRNLKGSTEAPQKY